MHARQRSSARDWRRTGVGILERLCPRRVTRRAHAYLIAVCRKPTDQHVKSWRALRLLWRAVGEKRFDGISNQRKCRIVWHFGNGFQRGMESADRKSVV